MPYSHFQYSHMTTIFGSNLVKYCYSFLWNGIERIGGQTAVEKRRQQFPNKNVI